jgi:hypothetical protein
MSRAQTFVGNFLAHYASEYYDPAKAREYYLRTRELKGKQSSSSLTVKGNKGRTEKRQQAWAYAKNQIGEAKKSNLESLSEQRKAIVENARDTALAHRQDISEKLVALLQTLTKQKTDDVETINASEESELARVETERLEKSRKIRADADRAVDAIPAIPDTIKGPQRARLVAAREKKIAKITGDANRQLGAVRADAATEREAISAEADDLRTQISAQARDQKVSERDAAKANRERVSTELKATVEKARTDYEAGKKRLIDEYEKKAQREFDAIRTRV